MDWTTLVWAMGASACLTISSIHGVIGLRRRAAPNLLFFVQGLAVAALAVFEVLLMRSRSPEEHARLLRWMHLPIFVVVVCLVFFIWTYLGAGRKWLGWAAIAARSACLALNFLVSPNFNYSQISGVRPIRFLGETIFVTVGTLSLRGRLGQVATILLLLFLVDATWQVWTRGERRRAAIIGGSTIVFIFVASVLNALILAGTLPVPYMISLTYIGVIAAMSQELTFDVIRASELAQDLKASEAALRESERRMSLAAEAAGVEFWLFDTSSGEYAMSEKERALRGFARGERIDARRFFDSVHPDDRDRLHEGIERALRRGDPLELEYRVLAAGGETRWIAARGRVETGSDGRTRLRGVSADVTRRKTAELEVEKQQLELTHLSRVSLLGELSGSIAHEINQPLAAILANAEAGQQLLSGDGVNLEEVREILADIIAADTHAGEVIHRLRLLLKKGDVESRPLNVSEVLHDSLELLRNDLLNRRVNVFAELPSALPAVVGDRTQIQQVMVNLVTNACDAMGGNDVGERMLTIRAAADGAGVLVSIRDRGPGIPPESAERLFEPFFTTKPHGLGLGLAVCRTIVAAHGGKLWAANNPEGGATFHFTLHPAASGENASPIESLDGRRARSGVPEARAQHRDDGQVRSGRRGLRHEEGRQLGRVAPRGRAEVIPSGSDPSGSE